MEVYETKNLIRPEGRGVEYIRRKDSPMRDCCHNFVVVVKDPSIFIKYSIVNTNCQYS